STTLFRSAEAVAASGLHLAEHHRGVAAEHEVELTLAAAPVPVEHPVPGGDVPARHRVLARGAEDAPAVGRHRSDLALVEFLDVDVLEPHHPHIGDEARRAAR